MLVAQTNGPTGYGIGHTGILHGFADGKGGGNGHEDVPRDKLGVFARREDIGPGHNDGGHADEEEHIELHAWHHVAHGGKFANGRAEYHQRKEDNGEPLLFPGHRCFLLPRISHHKEERRVAPVVHKGFVGQEDKGVAIVKVHFAHIVHEEV